MSQISLRDAEVVFVDGTGPTPNELIITVGEGNLTWTESRPLEYTSNRGLIEDRKLADDVPMSVSLDLRWDYYRGKNGGGEPPSPMDVIHFENNASTWVSTDTDPCRPKCIDIVIHYRPDCAETDSDETITLPKFFAEDKAFDLREGTIALTGTCLAIRALSVRTTP